MTLDRIDLKILGALQKDASLSTADVAQRVGLSQSPCWQRISQLETDGVIKQRVAVLARDKLGLDVLVLVHVKLASHGWQSLPKFKQKVLSFPEVMQCFMVMGDTDFVLLVATRTIDEYNDFIGYVKKDANLKVSYRQLRGLDLGRTGSSPGGRGGASFISRSINPYFRCIPEHKY